MGRYLERAEHTARVVNANLSASIDHAPEELARQWGRLLRALRLPPSVIAGGGPVDSAIGTTLDLANRDSIAACLAAARENARQVREQISSEMWEELNRLYLEIQNSDALDTSRAESMDGFFRAVISGIHLFQGVTDATMAHGEGYRFIELGRYLERTGATAALLDLHYRDATDASRPPADLGELVEWTGVLKACHAFEAYAQRFTADISAGRVAEFLILESDFPRSLRFGAIRIEAALDRHPGAHRQASRARPNEPRAACARRSITAVRTKSCSGPRRCWRRSSGRPMRSTMPSSGSTSTMRSRRGGRPDMRYAITHVTRFAYDRPVSESHMEVRLRPLPAIGRRASTIRCRCRRGPVFSTTGITWAMPSTTSASPNGMTR